ncbi:hypothetical protein HYZ76_01490 [Candidatus Falkowbacteria bacterium]|nr:hypothetical protein [Candidatus Falkowbacteria bacterium]
MAEEKIIDKDPDQDYGEVLFFWKFDEFPKYERSQGWYIMGGLVVGIFVLYAIFAANLLFGLITVIAALILLMFQRTNREMEFRITEDGILINKSFHDYKDIKNFWIIYEVPEVKTLYFEPKSFFNPRIPISLEDQDPVKIREVLLQYLEEDLEKENEPMSDQASRFFKL